MLRDIAPLLHERAGLFHLPLSQEKIQIAHLPLLGFGVHVLHIIPFEGENMESMLHKQLLQPLRLTLLHHTLHLQPLPALSPGLELFPVKDLLCFQGIQSHDLQAPPLGQGQQGGDADAAIRLPIQGFPVKICCDQGDEQGLLFQFSHKLLCTPYIKIWFVSSAVPFSIPCPARWQKVGLEHSQGTLQAA